MTLRVYLRFDGEVILLVLIEESSLYSYSLSNQPFEDSAHAFSLLVL